MHYNDGWMCCYIPWLDVKKKKEFHWQGSSTFKERPTYENAVTFSPFLGIGDGEDCLDFQYTWHTILSYRLRLQFQVRRSMIDLTNLIIQ